MQVRHNQWISFFWAFLLIVGSSAFAVAQMSFVEVGVERGILPFDNAMGMAAGMAAADFDNDGDVDLFVPGGFGAVNRLYRNLGNGFFEDIAGSMGLADGDNDRAALWFDFDGDGDLDLLVAGDDFQRAEVSSNLQLFRQDPAAFVDVTDEAGLSGRLNGSLTELETHLGGLSAADSDGDGDLDLVVTFWKGMIFFFRNNGGTSFENVASAVGIGDVFGTYWQPVFADFDGDGCHDLFVAVDFNDNLFFHNQCDGTFADLGVQLGMANESQNDMGAAVGDIEGDGDLDLFVTNVYSGPDRRNHLYRNESTPGQPFFDELAMAAGVADAGWAWGTTFADVDRDGREDLLVTNGFGGENDPSRLFKKLPGSPPTYGDIAPDCGFDDTCWGSALIAVDIDRDDDLDVLQTCIGGSLRVLDNRPEGVAEGVTIRPRMTEGANRFAIGAVVRLEVDGRTTAHVIHAGSGTLGQEPAEASYGIPVGSVADRVSVTWPDGRLTAMGGVESGQVVQVDERLVLSDGLESGTLAAWSSVMAP